MNLFDIFEDRMQGIFERGNSMAPFPFKKLARTAVREMKSCSAKLDGRVVAPTLYTILVNPADDALIGPLYQQVTDELVDFLAHEAQNAGLTLTSNPTVRFIPVADVKQGKMEVIAEIVSPDVLEQVRAEESDYLRGRGGSARGAQKGRLPQQGRVERRQAMPAQMQPAMGAVPGVPSIPDVPDEAGMDVMPQAPGLVGDPNPQFPIPGAAPTAAVPRPRPAARRAPVACQLTDKASGRTWRIATDSTVIGRDEAHADLVLEDSNVSRRHAELTRTATGWHIADLGSTNGTRVNGMRVPEQDLKSGDAITMGLVTLLFEEV